MRFSKRMSLSLLGLGLLMAGCAKNPADSVPSAQVQSSTPIVAQSGTPAPAASGSPRAAADTAPTPMDGTVYAFDEGSEVDFVGSKVTGSENGGFKKVQGTVTVPKGDLGKSAVDITVDMTSLWADKEKLQEHLASDAFFEVNKFPETTFKSTSISKEGDGYKVTGELTLHGVTKTISFPAKISLQGEALKTSAEFSINRKDFGIVYPGKPDDLIRDDVVIKYDITAGKKA